MPRRLAAVVTAACTLMLLSVACGGGDRVDLSPAFGGREFERPIELGPYQAGIGPEDGIYVALQDGRVLLLAGTGREHELLDLRGRLLGGRTEQGLLSVALDPLFSETGNVWVLYTAPGGASRLSRFTVDLQADSPTADLDTELVVLEVPEPWINHNGGSVRFGPDGMLYLGLGDGGGGGDPLGSGQDLSTLLGAVSRIDVRNASPTEPYTIPSDNPFLDVDGARGEIWAFGLRNPWRMAFDHKTGQLWLGDVGQNRIEEVNLVSRGANYGWNRMEGSLCFQPTDCEPDGITMPVAEYTHDDGCSITGGVVYRGSELEWLAGAYVYGDFCSGEIWALLPDESQPVHLARSDSPVVSFGTDARGEMYVLTFGDGILKITP